MDNVKIGLFQVGELSGSPEEVKVVVCGVLDAFGA